MFLSDVDIRKAVESGEIIIRPFSEQQLSVASYDVCLDNEFQVIDRHNTQVVDQQKINFLKCVH